MFKRIITLFLAITLIFVTYIINQKPVFYGYANQFEIYFGDSAYTPCLVTDYISYALSFNKKGESCKTTKKVCPLQIIQDFNATVVLTECVKNGTSYYAYSPLIPYKEAIGGMVVNLHIFVANDYTVLGCPLIYGSF